MDFHIWDASDPRDREAWMDFWTAWPEREVFGHPAYVKLYAGPHVRALCAATSTGGSFVLYPFLMRELGSEPYCERSLCECTDITSPYGYGGPFKWGAAWSSDAVRGFWLNFDTWAARSRVVSEVVRFSLFPETLVEYAGERRELLDNVVCTLRSEDELWQSFEYKVRKNVNKARASGATVKIDETGARLDDFMAIYAGTMDRRGQTHYFPREYFERIHAEMKGMFTYFHVFVGNVVVSTELVLISANRIYSYLGGTDAKWFHVRPNELLKFEIMNWGFRAGKKEFILGGGNARSDGIYRYKLSFAPQGTVPFSIGSRVLSAEAYGQLIASRRTLAARQGGQWQPKPEYFPAYRA